MPRGVRKQKVPEPEPEIDFVEQEEESDDEETEVYDFSGMRVAELKNLITSQRRLKKLRQVEWAISGKNKAALIEMAEAISAI